MGWGGACINVHVSLRVGACMHGWGGVGHVITFMQTCGGRTCLSVAAGRCMYARVGWGGVGHVITFM